MRGKRILVNPIDDYCNYKGDFIIMTNKAGYIEYKMPKQMAQEYFKLRKGEEQKMRPNEYLCKIVNENFGIKGYCTNVITF